MLGLVGLLQEEPGTCLSSSPEELAPGSFSRVFLASLAAKVLAEQLCHAG